MKPCFNVYCIRRDILIHCYKNDDKRNKVGRKKKGEKNK